MTQVARLGTQLGSYLVALTAADAVFSVMQFSVLILHNIPVWGGLPVSIVASDVFMAALTFFLQWPVILLLTALPFLIALLVQRLTRSVSSVVFLLTGALIGGLCSAAMYLLYFRHAFDDPDGPDPIFYFTHTGMIAVVSGIVGAYVYRHRTLLGSATAP